MTFRIIIAVVLCFFAYIVINFLMAVFFPSQPVKQPQQKPKNTQEQTIDKIEPKKDGTDTTIKQPEKPELTKPNVEVQEEEVKTYTLENDEITVEITNQNASIKSLRFKNYKSSTDKNSAFEILKEFQKGLTSLSVFLEGQDENSPLNWFTYKYEKDKEVKLYLLFDKIKLTKTFTLNEQSQFALNCKIEIEKLKEEDVNTSLIVYGPCGIDLETGNTYYARGVLGLKESSWKLDTVAFSTIQKKKYVGDRDDFYWGGVADKYFACVLIPTSHKISKTSSFGYLNYNFSVIDNNKICFYLKTKNIVLTKENPKLTIDYIMYTGPINKKMLVSLEMHGLPVLEDYGMFGFISKILLYCLSFFYSLFKNYGVAIIFLTLLVKIVLFPLTKKGQVSAYNLQKLQPRIVSIREKYKNDRKKMNEEMMRLYKEFGVNPFGGCLPLLLQIPVFIGLYRALELSVDLRQAGFMLWIQDLSQPDRLTKLPFSILGATDLNLLPIIMTVCWMIQTAMQPKSPDPQARAQQKIFMFMPLIFSILLYSMPSGLILYWLVSTFLGIIEQKTIKKFYLKS